MFDWNPTDLLECLEVEPCFDDDAQSHGYVVSRDGIRLAITVFDHIGDVYLTLSADRADAPPVLDLHIFDCPRIVLAKDDVGAFLEFHPGSLDNRGWQHARPIAEGIRVRIRPSILVELFRA